MIQSASEKCTYVGNTNTTEKDETTIIFRFKCHLESLYIVKTRHKNILASLFLMTTVFLYETLHVATLKPYIKRRFSNSIILKFESILKVK